MGCIFIHNYFISHMKNTPHDIHTPVRSPNSINYGMIDYPKSSQQNCWLSWILKQTDVWLHPIHHFPFQFTIPASKQLFINFLHIHVWCGLNMRILSTINSFQIWNICYFFFLQQLFSIFQHRVLKSRYQCYKNNICCFETWFLNQEHSF